MIPLLADHDFNERILKGLEDREPTIDLVRAREIGLAASIDAAILERAALEERIVLTHDRRTMPAFANARVAAGESMPGMFVVSKALPIGQTIDELLIGVHCLTPDECRDIVRYFPL